MRPTTNSSGSPQPARLADRRLAERRSSVHPDVTIGAQSQRRRSQVTYRVLAATAVLAASSCAADVSPAVRRAESDVAPVSQSRPTVSPAAARAAQAARDAKAIAAVDDFWDADTEVMSHSGDWDSATAIAVMSKVAQGEALDDEMRNFAALGIVHEVIRGTVVSHSTVVEHRGEIIVVHDCVDNQRRVYSLDDGMPTDEEDPGWHPFIFEMVPVDDGYRASVVTMPWAGCTE